MGMPSPSRGFFGRIAKLAPRWRSSHQRSEARESFGGGAGGSLRVRALWRQAVHKHATVILLKIALAPSVQSSHQRSEARESFGGGRREVFCAFVRSGGRRLTPPNFSQSSLLEALLRASAGGGGRFFARSCVMAAGVDPAELFTKFATGGAAESFGGGRREVLCAFVRYGGRWLTSLNFSQSSLLGALLRASAGGGGRFFARSCVMAAGG